MSKRETPHGAVSERFMRHHYGASGFVKKEQPMKESEEMAAENLQREKAIMRCCENGTFDIPHECRKKQERAASGQAGAGPRFSEWLLKSHTREYFRLAETLGRENMEHLDNRVQEFFPVSAPASQPSADKCPSCGATDNNPYIDSHGQNMRACGRCVIQWCVEPIGMAALSAPKAPAPLDLECTCKKPDFQHAICPLHDAARHLGSRDAAK